MPVPLLVPLLVSLWIAPAAVDAAPPSRQRACQEKVAAATLRPLRRPVSETDLAYLDPSGRMVECEGAAEVDALLVDGPRDTPFQGTEGATILARFDPLDFQLVVYPRGRRPGELPNLESRSFGLRSWARGTKAEVAQFKPGPLPPGEPRLGWSRTGEKSSPNGWVLNRSRWMGDGIRPVATDAPWVKLRLDDGELYLGQFANGLPHGFGLRYSPEHRAGRIGFFRDGVPAGYQFLWEDWTEPLRKGDEPLRPHGYTSTRVVRFRDGGVPEKAVFLDEAPLPDWVAADGRIPERRYRFDLGIPTVADPILPEDRAVGAIVTKDGKFYALANAEGTDHLLYASKLLSNPSTRMVVPEGIPVKVEGIGDFPNTRAARAQLRAMLLRQVRPNYHARFETLRVGDLVRFDKAIWVALRDFRGHLGTFQLVGPRFETIKAGAAIEIIPGTEAFDVPGYGRVEATVESRLKLARVFEEAINAKATEAARRKQQILDSIAAESARRLSVPSAWGGGYSPGFSLPGPPRSRVPASAPDFGPRIGTEAWHSQRAITHPSNYYQNSYRY